MPVPVFELLPYAAAAAALAASVWMFLLLKVELRNHLRRGERSRQAIEETCRRLSTSLDELRLRLEEAPPPGELPATRLRPSLNLSRRAQVLRLHRRGERPDQISSAIGIPQREVELLLKVHQATLAGLASPAIQ
jgi:hypothetical protein